MSLPPRVRLLAAYLFLRQGEKIPRSRLADLFWPEADTEKASASLRTALHTMRAAMDTVAAGSVIEIRRDSVCIPESACCDVDAHRFEATVRAALADGSTVALSDLVAAMSLYADDLLSGIEFSSADLEDHLLSERQRYRDLYVGGLSSLVGLLKDSGLPHVALDYAVRWRSLDPLNEEACRALMELYASTGQPARVEDEYERCRALLAAEIGVSPSEETVSAWEKSRRQAAAMQPQTAPESEKTLPREFSADPFRNAGFLTVLGEQQVQSGQVKEGLESLEEARGIYSRSGDVEHERRVGITLAGVLMGNPFEPGPDLAAALVMELLPAMREQGPTSDLQRALLIASDALQQCAEYEASLGLALEGLELARTAGNRDLETRFDLVLGMTYTYMNVFREAEKHLESAIAGIGRLYQPQEMLRVMIARGTLAALNESMKDAEGYLLEAVSIASRMPRTPLVVYTEGFARGMLVMLYWGLDRHEEARAAAEHAGFDLGSAPGGNIMQAICLSGDDPVTSARMAARLLRESLPMLPGWPGVGYTRLLWQQLTMLHLDEEALPWSALNIRLARRTKLKLYEGTGYSARGITLVRLGFIDRAEVCLSCAAELLDLSHHFSAAYYSYLEAMVANALGQQAAAEDAFERSIEAWKRVGDVNILRMIEEDRAAP